MATSKGIWCAIAAIALAPGAVAMGITAVDDVGTHIDLDAASLPRGATVPNPVVLGLDAADELGLALARHDADGVWTRGLPLETGLSWYAAFLEEDGVHTSYLLAFQESSDIAASSVLAAADEARGRLGLRPLPSLDDDATVSHAPRLLVDVDAAALRLAGEVDWSPPAQAGERFAAPAATGVAGPALAAGVPGRAPPPAALESPPLAAAESLAAARAPGGPATPSDQAVSAQGAGALPAAAAAHPAILAAGLVATGLVLGGLALYHLVNRNNIFENDVRMQVYDVVARNPGVTIQEVARVVGLSHPTARYHLNVLAKNDLVVFLDKGNKMMFFRNRNEFNEAEREVVAIVRNPEAMRVFECIEQSPWILRKELSERLGISRTSVNWHLRNLMRAGLVAETREQGKGFLFVRREGREMVLRVAPRVVREQMPPARAPAAADAPLPGAGAATGQMA